MKYYIEKDNLNRVVTKGTTIDDALIEKPLIEVTEEEFNAIEQYFPSYEEQPKEPTEQELLNAQILLENANMKKQASEQQALNANLLLDIAKLKGGA